MTISSPKTCPASSTERRVRDLACALGFDAVGFAKAGPVDPDTAAAYRDWLALGRHASMVYMERRVEERLDPRLLLPSAKTVVVLLKNHHREEPTRRAGKGSIARYAGGRDYHKVLRKPLEKFCRELQGGDSEAEFYWELDTGPVLERYWAEKAGVGWIGKNTMSIHTGIGSWTFLAVVLTSLELEPDRPHPDRCGTCTRCLDACPTDAFPEPGVLDSRLCISYWTIESRAKDFPAEIVAGLNGWTFGCDDCQTVCPWNRRAPVAEEPEFETRGVLRDLNLVEWASLSRAEWDEATRGTALRRCGYEGFRRNGAAALESMRERERIRPSRKDRPL